MLEDGFGCAGEASGGRNFPSGLYCCSADASSAHLGSLPSGTYGPRSQEHVPTGMVHSAQQANMHFSELIAPKKKNDDNGLVWFGLLWLNGARSNRTYSARHRIKLVY